MAIGLGTSALVNGAIGATGIGGQVSSGESSNSGIGFGLNSGKSFSQGGSSSYDLSDSFNQSWSRQYGSEASAQEIANAEQANRFNEKWMQKNMDFQEYMSNTSYQRMVKDLIAAGLNPYLAATNLSGASTPGGAMVSAAKANAVPDVISESSGGGHSEGAGNSYNVGGSENYGINFEINSGKSSSQSAPALGNIIGNAVKNAVASTSGKSGMTIGEWQAAHRSGGSSGSGGSFKGFMAEDY